MNTVLDDNKKVCIHTSVYLRHITDGSIRDMAILTVLFLFLAVFDEWRDHSVV